jgi:nucleotide-binding universal stress UspA family protein
MSWLPKTCVVVPYDFSERSAQTLAIARDMVADLTQLHVIHALPTITASDPGMIWEVVDNDARRRNATKAFHDDFASSPFHKADFHVAFGDPGNEIASYAEKLKADLIVMPSHGRNGVARLLIGSVAERVVRLAHCPVLILRGLSGKFRDKGAATPPL